MKNACGSWVCYKEFNGYSDSLDFRLHAPKTTPFIKSWHWSFWVHTHMKLREMRVCILPAPQSFACSILNMLWRKNNSPKCCNSLAKNHQIQLKRCTLGFRQKQIGQLCYLTYGGKLLVMRLPIGMIYKLHAFITPLLGISSKSSQTQFLEDSTIKR